MLYQSQSILVFSRAIRILEELGWKQGRLGYRERGSCCIVCSMRLGFHFDQNYPRTLHICMSMLLWKADTRTSR